ncbi:MAG: hypothetical protein ABIL47_09185 [candidate division WOR-3 bacterium]
MMEKIKESAIGFFSNAMGVFCLLIICSTLIGFFNEGFARNGLKDVYIMIITGVAGLTEPHSLLSNKNKISTTRKRPLDE